jgi:hypothetical protein
LRSINRETKENPNQLSLLKASQLEDVPNNFIVSDLSLRACHPSSGCICRNPAAFFLRHHLNLALFYATATTTAYDEKGT